MSLLTHIMDNNNHEFNEIDSIIDENIYFCAEKCNCVINPGSKQEGESEVSDWLAQ